MQSGPDERTALKISARVNTLQVEKTPSSSNTDINQLDATRQSCRALHISVATATAGIMFLLLIVHKATAGGHTILPVAERGNNYLNASSASVPSATDDQGYILATTSVTVTEEKRIPFMQPFSTVNPKDANCPHMDRPVSTWPTKAWGRLANASMKLHASLPTNAWWENVVLGSPTQVGDCCCSFVLSGQGNSELW